MREYRKATGADFAHQMPGYLDVRLDIGIGLLRERGGKGLGVEAEFCGDFAQGGRFSKPPAATENCRFFAVDR